MIAVVSVCFVAAVLWTSGVWGDAVWSDGASIQAPASSTVPRDILWNPPVSISLDDKDSLDCYEPRLNWDGSTMFFAMGRPESLGTPSTIWTMERTPSGWSEPVQFGISDPGFNDLGPEPTQDDNALYFASDREGGYGGFDIWVIRRTSTEANGNVWGEPTNLGPSINSAFDEYSPALTPGSDRLFFASNRPRPDSPPAASSPAWSATLRENIDRNGFDLFAAPMIDGVFTDAEPLRSINSDSNDGAPAIAPFGDFLYFTSNRSGGAGGFDLWRVRLLTDGGFGKPEPLGDQINTPWNELDPGLAMGGHELAFSTDRPLQNDGSDTAIAAGVYRIFTSTAREVYLERATTEASLDWLWWLLWLLMCLLALLLLLFLLRRLMASDWSGRMKKLGLFAQCVLLSLLVHALLMLALTVWHVAASVGESLRGSGATKVALTTSAGDASSGISSQLMSTSVPMHIEAPSIDRINPTALTIEAPQPAPAQQLTMPITVTADATPIEVGSQPMESTPLPEFTPEAPKPINTPSLAEQTIASSDLAQPEIEGATLEAERELTPRASDAPRSSQAVHAVDAVAIDSEPSSLSLSDLLEPSRSSAGTSVFTTDPLASPEIAMDSVALDRASVSTPALQQPIASNELSLPDRHEPATTDEAPREIQVAAAPAPANTQQVVTLAAPTSAPMVLPRLDPTISSNENDVARSLIYPDSSPMPDAGISAPVIAESHSIPDALPRAMMSGIDLPEAAIDTEAIAEGDAELQEIQIASADPLSRMPSLDTPTFSAEIDVPSLSLDSGLITPSDPMGSIDELLEMNTEWTSIETPSLSLNTPIEAPAFMPDLTDLSIPIETAPPVDAFTQRDEAVREDVVEAMGGSEETEEAVAMAMDWLARHQSRDGRWDSDGFDPTGSQSGRSRVECDVAVTGLALLVFLGADQTHTEEGPYRENVENGLRWLLTRLSRSGDIRAGETMYSQGIATIALCEAYGMTGDERLREPAQRAIEFIVSAQNPSDRGWRYEPGMSGDTSVLGWQVMAMISAKKVGLHVPQRTLDGSKAWLDGVSRSGSPGLYAYQRHKAPTLSMTAEGMFIQHLLGAERETPRMAQSAAFIGRHAPNWEDAANTYGWYYATLALFQHQGAEWEAWNDALADELVDAQRDAGPAMGSWDPADQWSRVGGRVYQTAICALSLEVYYRYLPLYLTEATPADGD